MARSTAILLVSAIFSAVLAGVCHGFVSNTNNKVLMKKSSPNAFVSSNSARWNSASSSLQMNTGNGVVITGAAGGVGFAYAGEFMD
eukprot:5930907-Ditylum_brightwellii.AAC.1